MRKNLFLLLGFIFLLLRKQNLDLNVFAQDNENEEVEDSTNTSYYFDFQPNTYLIPKSGIINITIDYKEIAVDKANFRVRPFIKDAVASIYDPEKNTWIFSGDAWGNLPSIGEGLKITLPTELSKVELVLKIKDLTTGKEYETPTKAFWTANSYGIYEKKVNQTIRDWRQNTSQNSSGEITAKNEENSEDLAEPEEQTQTLDQLKNKSNRVMVNIGGFAFSAIVGFLKKDDKMPL